MEQGNNTGSKQTKEAATNTRPGPANRALADFFRLGASTTAKAITQFSRVSLPLQSQDQAFVDQIVVDRSNELHLGLCLQFPTLLSEPLRYPALINTILKKDPSSFVVLSALSGLKSIINDIKNQDKNLLKERLLQIVAETLHAPACLSAINLVKFNLLDASDEDTAIVILKEHLDRVVRDVFLKWLFAVVEQQQREPFSYLQTLFETSRISKAYKSILIKKWELRHADPQPQEPDRNLFVPSFSELPRFEAYRDRLFSVYHSLDSDHDGLLDAEDLMVFCQRIGQVADAAVTERAINAVDHDGDGRVNAMEFYEIFAGKLRFPDIDWPPKMALPHFNNLLAK